MSYPKNNTFIDMCSKIKQPNVSKTKSILLELDKLKSDASVVVRSLIYFLRLLNLAKTPNFAVYQSKRDHYKSQKSRFNSSLSVRFAIDKLHSALQAPNVSIKN